MVDVDNVNIVDDNDGNAVIEGTPYFAEEVLSEVWSGKNRDDILRTYPGLPEGSIEACINWYRER